MDEKTIEDYRKSALLFDLFMYRVDPNTLPQRLQTVERPKPLFDNGVNAGKEAKPYNDILNEDSKPYKANLNERADGSLEDILPKDDKKMPDYAAILAQDRAEYRRDYGFEIIDLGKLVAQGGEIAVCPVDHMSSDPSVRRIVYRTEKGKPIQVAYVQISGDPDSGFSGGNGGPGGDDDEGFSGPAMGMTMLRMHLGE